MVRGINKSAIFKNDTDRARFLRRLGEKVIETKSVIYAWVLMNNHIHILFRSGQDGISTVMRKVLTWYAVYFNREHKRTGHLFENRYKSILCEEETYLLALVRYIHLNPIRAKIVGSLKELDHYPWSGHRALVGIDHYPWMDPSYVLFQFGPRRKEVQKAYEKFMKEGILLGHSHELTGGGLIRSLGGWSQVLSQRRKGHQEESDERILGSGEFVKAVLTDLDERQMRQLKLNRSGMTLTNIMAEEGKRHQVTLNELSMGSRRKKVSRARAAIAFRGMVELGLSAAEIARHLGVNTSSITRAVEKLRESREGEQRIELENKKAI
jgi:REP-associated tyrosine transposase